MINVCPCPLWINRNHSVKLNELHYNWIAHRRHIASWGRHIYVQVKIWSCFHLALVLDSRKYTDYRGTFIASVNEIVRAFAKQIKHILVNSIWNINCFENWLKYLLMFIDHYGIDFKIIYDCSILKLILLIQFCFEVHSCPKTSKNEFTGYINYKLLTIWIHL